MKLSEVLRSLAPTDPEELSVLQTLIEIAQALHARAQRDLGFIWSSASQRAAGFDLPELFNSLSEESRRYFYGLVEAVEIYQSIHGCAFSLESLALRESSVNELRQIRDLCLQDGLRSGY